MLRNTKAITTFEERVQVENEMINGFESMGAIRRNHVREPAVVRDKFKNTLFHHKRQFHVHGSGRPFGEV
jgi:hypothetical protein